ncbi:MAG: hypothetical protein QMD77_04680 [Patescibacteria group bacterium]|nr:hypothetical protein [Patescibacteria group bacterium]
MVGFKQETTNKPARTAGKNPEGVTMKVLYFLNPHKKTGKFFMILILTFAEKMALAKGSGFDNIIGASGWIKESALQGSLRLPDKEAYVFRGYPDQLDFIPHMLEEKANWLFAVEYFPNTPTYAELLARENENIPAGVWNIYIDHTLPPARRYGRYLWGIYRPRDDLESIIFHEWCSGSSSRVAIKYSGRDIFVTYGMFRSGYGYFQSFFNEHQGFSMTSNILDYVGYPELLIKSVL